MNPARSKQIIVDSRQWTGDPPPPQSREAMSASTRNSNFQTDMRGRDLAAWWSLVLCLLVFGWVVSTFLRRRGEWDYLADPAPDWPFAPAAIGIGLAILLSVWKASPLRNSWRIATLGVGASLISMLVACGYFSYAYRVARPARTAHWAVSQIVDYDRCRRRRWRALIPCNAQARPVTIGFTFADGTTATARAYGRRMEWGCVLLRKRAGMHGLTWLKPEDYIDLNGGLDENGLPLADMRGQCLRGELAH